MPRKRRRAKRGPEELERRVWSGIFDTGYDFFDELPEIGVGIGSDLKADPVAAENAWHRYGADYLAELLQSVLERFLARGTHETSVHPPIAPPAASGRGV